MIPCRRSVRYSIRCDPCDDYFFQDLNVFPRPAEGMQEVDRG